MGGEIRAYSERGKGSCFTICIPCEQVPLTNENSPRLLTLPSVVTPISSNFPLMIVDDNRLNIQILSQFLQRMNLNNIISASNGTEAFAKYCESIEKFSLKTYYYGLRNAFLNGKEASKKIPEFEKSRKLNPVTIIMISGNCTESEIPEYTRIDGEIRAKAFLKKPVKFKDFKQLLYDTMNM